MDKKQLKGVVLKEKGEGLRLSIHKKTFDAYTEGMTEDSCGWLHFNIHNLPSQHYNGTYFKIKPEKQ